MAKSTTPKKIDTDEGDFNKEFFSDGLPDMDDVFPEPPNVAFTDEEVLEIEEIANKYPVIRKLLDRYMLLFSEPDKEFYAALSFAANEVSNHVFNKTLNIDNAIHKAMMSILEKGGAYYKTLQVGREKAGNPNASDEADGIVDNKAASSEKPIQTISERYAKRAR